MKIIPVIALLVLSCLESATLVAQTSAIEGVRLKVPILHHYDDPASEVWEITFKSRTFIDTDVERPISDFRLSSLTDHVKVGATAMPVLFVLEIPPKTELAAFGDRVVKLLSEANRVSLPYSAVIRLHDRASAQPMRTSELPPDVPTVILKADGVFVCDGAVFTGNQLCAALLDHMEPFRSQDLKIELEPASVQSPVVWAQLYDLLALLNRVEPNGRLLFRYSLALQTSGGAQKTSSKP
jgi:hypothetical protein